MHRWILVPGVAAALVVLPLQGSAQTASGSGEARDTTTAPPPPTAPPPHTPPDFPRGRISGYMFGDLYYNVSGDAAHAYGATGADAGQVNVDGAKPIAEDLNGIQLRRVYFQLDNDLSVRIATRFRLEADSRALTSDAKLAVFVKNASLQLKSLVPRGDAWFGLIAPPTFENSEEFWQYRSIEKTIVDFRGLASSTDLGVELKGHLDPAHHLGYAAMVGDGTGQRPENDRYKRFYFALPIRFGELRLEPYADHQRSRVNRNLAAPAEPESVAVAGDQTLWKVFAGYELRRLAVGVEALQRITHRDGLPTQDARGLSVFARSALTPVFGIFGRVDFWRPDENAADRVDSRLWIAGLDWMPFRDPQWQPLKDVHVMPNVEIVEYLAKGTATAPARKDIQARITLYYRYSKPQS